MRPTGSPEELERRRERAIRLLQDGYAPVEVAQRVGVARRSVRRWKAAFRRRGKKGIRARKASGRPPKLDGSQRRRLERLLLKGAKAAGFPTDLWTCPRIAQLVGKAFGVSYHRAHVGRLLRSLGWSAQRPERRAVERDEEAIRRWVKVEWPRIKKKSIG
jgi:transposase